MNNNVNENIEKNNNIIITKQELSEDIIKNKIKKYVEYFDYNFTEEEMNLILKENVAQIENMLDRLSNSDFSLQSDYIEIPGRPSDKDGNMVIEDSILKRAEIKNNKQGILDFIDEICKAGATYGAKGVIRYGNK